MRNTRSGEPPSDESVRNRHAPFDGEEDPQPDEATGGQTSNKSGKHSTVKKLAASRPELKESPGAHPVAGAFGGGEDKVDHGADGDKAWHGE